MVPTRCGVKLKVFGLQIPKQNTLKTLGEKEILNLSVVSIDSCIGRRLNVEADHRTEIARQDSSCGDHIIAFETAILVRKDRDQRQTHTYL